MVHMRTCQNETFYNATEHLHDKNWVEAPKNQHIVINEEATNVVLKTTGLWLMPEPPDQQINSDALRGFWVMPSSTSDYIDEQLRQQQEKLRIEQETKRIQEEQARLEREERARLQREEEENQRQLLLQRQLLEEQQKLRLQQQLQQQQEQQKQMLLQQQQQFQRQSQSVVHGISSVSNHSVPIVKSSPAAVINHQNAANIQTQRSHAAATNTIIVLNDEQLFNQSGTEGLRCIQASDGSYHVIGNVDLNDRQTVANATSVIAHTSPVLDAQVSVASAATSPAQLPPPPPQAPTTSGRKRRGGRQPKQNLDAYTHQNTGTELITLENVYQTQQLTVPAPVAPAKTAAAKRRRAPAAQQQIVDASSANVSIDTNQSVIQNLDVADIPPQQFYLAYNDNGVLVPVDTTTTLLKSDAQQNNAVDLSQEQYIIEDLDASRKAQQKQTSQTQRNRSTARSATATTSAVSQPMATTSAAMHVPSNNSIHQSVHVSVGANGANDLSTYNIDDLSHLDRPIASEKPSNPIKPLNAKPQFMDSFFSFLMNRESNKL